MVQFQKFLHFLAFLFLKEYENAKADMNFLCLKFTLLPWDTLNLPSKLDPPTPIFFRQLINIVHAKMYKLNELPQNWIFHLWHSNDFLILPMWRSKNYVHSQNWIPICEIFLPTTRYGACEDLKIMYTSQKLEPPSLIFFPTT